MPVSLAAAVLLSLLAAPAPVTPSAPGPAPEPLVEPAQLRALCAALERTDSLRPAGDANEVAAARSRHDAERAQALERSWRVEIPSKGFAFGHVRADRDEVELDGDRPLLGLGNTLALDLAGIDDVAFHATAAQLAEWSRQKKAGAIVLAVVFRADGERCAGSAAAPQRRLGGRPLSWQLLGAGGAVLAAADEEGNPIAAATAAASAGADGGAAAGAPAGTPALRRTVTVEKLSLDADGADEAKVRLDLEPAALDRCAATAARAGSLAVVFSLQGGRLRDAQVVMDSVRDDEVSACIARALAGAPLAGAGTASGRGTLTLGLQ